MGFIMKKIIFGVFLIAPLLVGCKVSHSFLIDSNLDVKYNRLTGDWYLVFHSTAIRHQFSPDSMQIKPVVVVDE